MTDLPVAEEDYIVFTLDEEGNVGAVVWCRSSEEAEKEYEAWRKEWSKDANVLYIAQIIKKPMQEGK